ncbi:MAG: beta-lactamase family protein [Aequorivita sp.]|nr:beta-lactamase family protein [Aequorivita sp.]
MLKFYKYSNYIKALVVFPILLIFLSSCSLNQDCEKLKDLSVVKEYPGMIIGKISANGKPQICAFGNADIKTMRAINVQDKFHIASVTKLFTATAILKMRDEGKLNLNDKVTKYLDFPELKAIPQIQSVSIMNLLDHSSGIYGFNNDPEYIETLLGAKADQFKKWDPLALLALADSTRVEPFGKLGTGHYYGDTNYVLLGLIIEKVSEMPFSDFIKETIFKPLHLSNTGFYGDLNPDVKGYLKRSEILESIVTINPVFKAVNDSMVDATKAVERIDAAAGIVSNANDLLEFAKAIYMTDFLSSDSKNLLLNTNLKMATDEDCMQSITKKCNSKFGSFIASEGDGPGGINLLLAFNPEQKEAVIAFTNIFGNFNELDRMREEILDYYFSEK